MDRYRPTPLPADSDTFACLSTLVKIQHNLLECSDAETLFASLLPDIRLATSACYAYFFRNVPLFDGQPTYSLVAESHLPNLPSRKDRPNFALLLHAHLPNWTAALMHHGLVFGTPNDFAGEERFFMSLHGIHSILLVPVIAGKQFLGFLGIDDCTEARQWSAADKALLQNIAFALAHTLLRLQTTQDLQRACQEKTELMEILAHDLKNPLSAISLSVDTLLRKHDRISSEQLEKRLSQIKESVHRMTDICHQMLRGEHLLSSESGFTVLHPEPLGLANLIETLVEALQLQATAKNLQLMVEASKSVPKAFADRIAVLQILENLISNAIKFSPFGKRIWIRLRAHHQHVRIEVADEGPGIKPQEMKRLFQKRMRLSAQPTGGESSTGYGLWICKTLVDAMRGRIWCESTEGQGATFIVELPISHHLT